MSYAAPAAPRGPVRFGKYVLIDRLAVGGMAEIFLARQDGQDGFARSLVLKRIRPHLGKEPAFVKMFLNEARLAAQLNHPNVVQIFDLGKVADSYYLAMEYVSGRDMRKVIPRAEEMGIPFPLVYALKIASSVCEGLHYAHQRTDLAGRPLGIVHRDITPENVLVSFDGSVKILDFGIAKAAGQVEQTGAGEIKGKLSYLSPEQAAGEALDARSDVFSLGVVLYEWLTGFRLFRAESEVAILKSILEGRIHAPSYFRPEIPEEVERIVMRALEKDRDRRYGSAWELQRDIDRYLTHSEFTPSNVHLANFMKQLFFDELQEEEARLAPGAALTEEPEALLPIAETLPPSGEHRAPRLADAPPPPTDEREAARGTEQFLPIVLSTEELRRLTDVAKRNGLAPEVLAREVLSHWLKYR